jgi:D-alanyl-D-alanine carboxypeptidase
MNRRAEELGLGNTRFENPSGLDGAAHYTTALDLAMLGAYAMKNRDFAEIVSTYKTRITYKGVKNGRLLVNHNEMLRTYDGAIGIKTGYTRRSGRCLVTCAERDGVILVAATSNGRDDWNDHRSLLDYGFGQLKRYNLFSTCPEITANVVGGMSETVRCDYGRDVTAVLKSDEHSRVKMRIEMKKFYYAPVSEGQAMGKIVFTLDDQVLAETGITAAESAGASEKKGLLRGIVRYFKNLLLLE